ncbi:MAG: CvpA family protein [Clostridiales bacterium]|nr:CvpA family protein [Clostridiales bacterium]
MNFIIDILLIALFVFFVVRGAKKGFALSLLEFAATILAGVVAYYLSGIIAPIMYATTFEKTVVNSISAQIGAGGASVAQEAAAVIDTLPGFLIKGSSAIGIDVNHIMSSINTMNLSGASVAQALSDNIVEPIVTAFLRSILFIVLLVISIVVLKFVVRIVNKIFKLPILNSANKILGAVMGALKGVVAVLLVSLSLSMFVSLEGDTTSVIAKSIESSKIVSVADNFNPILKLKV